MKTTATHLPDVTLIETVRHGDHRGYFSETFRDNWFRENVADIDFVQENHSKSAQVGTLRGLHFQTPPFAQAKLVRCLTGAIWDVAVDIRKDSATYGQWAAAQLSEENGLQLYIPAGFAHGFITLEADTEIAYKCSNYYSAENDGGIAWNDPDLDLPWPIEGYEPVLSAKDQEHPNLADFSSPFTIE